MAGGLATACLLGAGGAWVYLRFPTRVLSYDGIVFGSVVEYVKPTARAQLFHPNHLLFNPAGLLFRRLSRFLGGRGDGYASLQVMNALAGAAGVGVLCRLAAGMAGSLPAGAAAAGLFAVSYAFWWRATDAQVYPPSLLALLIAFSACLPMLERFTVRRAVLAGAASALAVGFHQTNVLFFPAGACAAWRGGGRRGAAAYLGIAGGLTAGLYLAIMLGWQHLTRLREMVIWVLGNAGPLYGGGGAEEYWRFNWLAPVEALRTVAAAVVVRAPQFAHGTAWRIVALAAVCGCAVPAVVSGMRSRRGGQVSRVLLIWAAAYAAFFTWWAPGDVDYWIGVLVPLLLLVALSLNNGRPGGRPYASWSLVGCVVLVGTVNFFGAVRPNADEANNPDMRKAVWLRERIASEGVVLLSGVGGWTMGKAYLPRYTRTSSAVLEWLLGGGKEEGLKALREEIEFHLRLGLPVYALSDLVEWNDPKVEREFSRTYQVSRREVEEVLRPYRFSRVAAYGPGFTLYQAPPRSPAPVTLADFNVSGWDVQRLNKLGVALGRQGRYGEAIRCFARVLREFPLPSTYNNLAVCLYKTGRKAEAVAALERSLSLDPNDPAVRRNLEALRRGSTR